MFKTLEKKKTKPFKSKPVTTEVTCSACGYVRKDSDTNPVWQCPSCEVAYVKAEEAHKEYSKAELKQRNTEYQSEKKRKSKLSAITTGLKGIWFGIAAFISGAGSACSNAASNPLLQAAGAVLVIGSVAYILLKTLGS